MEVRPNLLPSGTPAPSCGWWPNLVDVSNGSAPVMGESEVSFERAIRRSPLPAGGSASPGQEGVYELVLTVSLPAWQQAIHSTVEHAGRWPSGGCRCWCWGRGRGGARSGPGRADPP